jgi:hypothetical protein
MQFNRGEGQACGNCPPLKYTMLTRTSQEPVQAVPRPVQLTM